MERADLELLVSSAFCGGERLNRQLRLSDEDARFLAEHYPVTLAPLGEQWYQITFHSMQR